MDTIKEYATLIVAVVTLLLVGSIKMDSCQMKKELAKATKVEKHQKAERGQRGSRRGRVAPKGDDGRWQERGLRGKGSKGDSGRGEWLKRIEEMRSNRKAHESHPKKK